MDYKHVLHTRVLFYFKRKHAWLKFLAFQSIRKAPRLPSVSVDSHILQVRTIVYNSEGLSGLHAAQVFSTHNDQLLPVSTGEHTQRWKQSTLLTVLKLLPSLLAIRHKPSPRLRRGNQGPSLEGKSVREFELQTQFTFLSRKLNIFKIDFCYYLGLQRARGILSLYSIVDKYDTVFDNLCVLLNLNIQRFLPLGLFQVHEFKPPPASASQDYQHVLHA